MNNKKQSSEKEQIKKSIKFHIEKGVPKQQILEELSQTYKDKTTIVKQLEATPSKLMKHKFKMLNNSLALLLIIVLALDTVLLLRLEWGNWVIDVSSMLNIILDIVFVIGVLLFRIESYSWIAARVVTTIFPITASFTHYHISVDTLTFVSLALIVASLLLGLLLSIKLCPPRVPKIIEVYIDGTKKINKTVYVFPD